MKTEERSGSTTAGPLIVSAALMSAGASMALTTLLLAVSRFASIENRTDRLGEELYLELAPALPSEKAFLLLGLVMAVVGAALLLFTAIRRRRS